VVKDSVSYRHTFWSDTKTKNINNKQDDGQCIWYGTCAGCVPGHADYNIAYDGPAKPMTDPADIKMLKGVCPELFLDLGNNSVLLIYQLIFYDKLVYIYSIAEEGVDPLFCCNHRQVKDLDYHINLLVGLVGRCPSCARNLRVVFCSMSCDPYQSKYLSINKTLEDYVTPGGDNLTLITALNYHINENFVQGLYNSCIEVVNPSSNSLALTTYCGSWGEDCDAHRLFDAMGLSVDNGGFSPFDIYFDYAYDDTTPPEGIVPFDPTAIACYESISVS